MSSRSATTLRCQKKGIHLSINLQQAMLTFVVNVESTRPEVNPAGLLRLATLLDHYRLPASWSFAADAHSQPLKLLLGRIPGADLLLQGSPSWIGPDVSRTHFAQGLEQRVTKLNLFGKHPSGICVPSQSPNEHLDLLVKHKLRWIVLPDGKRREDPEDVRAISGRFGIHSARPSWSIPHPGGWRRAWQRLGNRRRLANLVAAQEPTVARIELPKLLKSPQSWTELDDLFKSVARWRSRGKLLVESLAGVTLVLDPPKRAAMRSILRSAA